MAWSWQKPPWTAAQSKGVAPSSSARLLSQRNPYAHLSQSGCWEAGCVSTMSLKGETEHWEG